MVSDEQMGDLERAEEKQWTGMVLLVEIDDPEYFLTMGTLSIIYISTRTRQPVHVLVDVMTLRLLEG